MGMDIHMDIVKDGKIIKKDIFDGRSYEWFGNLCRNGDKVYDSLPTDEGMSPMHPDIEKYDYLINVGYFDFYHMSVGEFKDWFNRYRPDKNAGWVTKREAWEYEKRGICPELEYCLDETDIIEDRVFIEIVNQYDCSSWLFQYLIENNIDNDADINYYFDW